MKSAQTDPTKRKRRVLGASPSWARAPRGNGPGGRCVSAELRRGVPVPAVSEACIVAEGAQEGGFRGLVAHDLGRGTGAVMLRSGMKKNVNADHDRTG